MQTKKQIIKAYDYQEIVNAGNYLEVGEGHFEQMDTVYWWRKMHADPLQHLFCRLWTGPNEFVAQRLKRLASIKKKLLRNKKLTLWDMQDIGGCRVVVANPKDLKKAVAYDIGEPFKKVRRSNYIKKPKKDGYRGVHRIYRYEPYFDSLPTMDFEVQYRTSLQHLWATAVESYSTIKGYDLKAGEGPENVKRFFVLASSLFALEEGLSVVPDTSTDRRALLLELCDLANRTHIIEALISSSIKDAVWCSERGVENTTFSLLCLDVGKRVVESYEIRDMIKAITAYDVAETHPYKNVVLTRVVKVPLRIAYPNYWMNASGFLHELRRIAEKVGFQL